MVFDTNMIIVGLSDLFGGAITKWYLQSCEVSEC